MLYGVILEIFLLGILSIGNLRQEIPLFLLFYFLAFVTFIISTRHCQQADDQAESRVYLLLIISFAMLFRATLLFSEPSLSEDIYRYQWDGKLLNEGVNPYQYVPGEAELADLRNDQYQVINHKEIGTPYGPLSIMVFAITNSINSSVYFMKVPFILFDCLVIFLIIKMLSIAGVSKYNVIFYAWNPLVLVEVAGSGHNDSLGVLLLLGALYFIQRGNYLSSAIGFALALMTKYVALLFLPAVLKYFRKGEWIVIPLIFISGFFYFVEHLESHVLNLMQVGSSWRFNDSLFSLLLLLTGSLYFSKILVISIMLALSVFVLCTRKTVLESSMIMIGAALLLTTTVQPWYLLWMIPFLCFFPNRAWLLLTGLTMLAYHVLIRYQSEGIWLEALWVKLAIYVPFYLLLIFDSYRAFVYRRSETS